MPASERPNVYLSSFDLTLQKTCSRLFGRDQFNSISFPSYTGDALSVRFTIRHVVNSHVKVRLRRRSIVESLRIQPQIFTLGNSTASIVFTRSLKMPSGKRPVVVALVCPSSMSTQFLNNVSNRI